MSTRNPSGTRDASAARSALAELDGLWRIDPTRSTVEFQVPNLWGLMTVTGVFNRFEGTLELGERPTIELILDADSIDTGMGIRDKHLRSAAFFDVANQPQVRFASGGVTVNGDALEVRGRLHAAGKSIPLGVDARLRHLDGELEVEATALADHRELGMNYSPLGMIRTPSRLLVRGRLVREEI